MRALLVLALAGCGSKPSEPPRLVALVEVPGAELVAGADRVALATANGWLEPAPGTPRPVPAIATELVRRRTELGELRLFLGRTPIAIGGEEHHEHAVRLGGGEVELDGHVERIVALSDGTEVWAFEERLRSQLAVVDARGVTVLPGHERVGPVLDSPSPVSAKRCAAPRVADLAATATEVLALLVECSPEAPVRVARYRFPGPRVELETVRPGFVPAQLAVDGSRRVLVGVRDGVLAGVPGGLAASAVQEAVLGGDGAVWTLSLTAQGTLQLARDGVVFALADPAGRPVAPRGLARDARYGVTVLAGDWLFVERP